MTIRIRLGTADLGRVRFGISPLYETVRCLRVLENPGEHAIHLPWVRWAGRRGPTGSDVTLLRRLVTGAAVPVGLVPPPDSHMPSLAHELRRVRQANPDRVRMSLDMIFGARPWLSETYADPTTVLTRLAEVIDQVYRELIEPHWPRMRVILEADIEHRARILAASGVETVISGLHPDVAWDDGDVLVWPNDSDLSEEVTTAGAGLILAPTVFGWPRCTSTARPTGAAPVRYPARGIGTLWERRAQRPVAALAELLGSTRAQILLALAELRDTPSLAAQLGVTAGAVSQHLRVLRDAGLVRTQRTGRTAVHLRTAKADELVRD
jgi:DNA-binding transcriptional ArsR family regulator